MIKKLIFAAALFASTMGLTACGEYIQPGNVGILTKQWGSEAGVDPTPIATGRKITGIGEDIIQYPIIERTYTMDKITFSDRNGAPLGGAVNAQVSITPAAAPKIYVKYKLTFEDLLNGPIKNDVRTAIAEEAELIPIDTMLGGGRQPIIQRAYAKVNKKWAKEGVNINKLEWLGALDLPKSVEESIAARTRAEQEKLRADAQVAVAEAQAKEKVAIAQGDADAARIRGDALRSNPQVLQQQAIEKWDGKLPTYLGAGQPVPFVNAK